MNNKTMNNYKTNYRTEAKMDYTWLVILSVAVVGFCLGLLI